MMQDLNGKTDCGIFRTGDRLVSVIGQPITDLPVVIVRDVKTQGLVIFLIGKVN